jgi:hypothetical protein
MPIQPTDTQIRLNTLTTCFTITVETLEILVTSLQAAFMEAIANTTRSLLKNIEVGHLQALCNYHESHSRNLDCQKKQENLY